MKQKRTEPSKKCKIGKGIINSAINLLPFEMHLPGYQYCGPGTKLKKRLKRGDPGINKLDKACRLHDMAYDMYPKSNDRRLADEMLMEKAIGRSMAKDASFGEKTAALSVAGLIKAKTAVGAGLKKIKKN